MRKARVRSPQYSRFLTSPWPSAINAAKVSMSASTCDAEISWRAIKTVSYNDIPCDPLWIFATRRWSTFDGSRSGLAGTSPARSEGAHYTQSEVRRKQRLRGRAVGGRNAPASGGLFLRAGYFGTLAVVVRTPGLSLFCIVRAYSQFHAQALAVMRSRLTSPDMLMANSPLPSPAKMPPFETGALSTTLLPAASGR